MPHNGKLTHRGNKAERQKKEAECKTVQKEEGNHIDIIETGERSI